LALTANTYYRRRARMLDFLCGLEKTGDSTASTVYLPPGLAADQIKDALPGAADKAAFPEGLAEMLARSRTGGVLFWGSAQKHLVLPPFPLREQALFNGFAIGPLVNLLKVDYTIGLVLVHLGAYAVGLCRGEELVTSKVGTGLVHGRYRKGGSSQMRFQRRRANQADAFLDRVCLHAHEQFESRARDIDYLVYGGPRPS
jgi:hypothetical protein